MNRVAYAFQEVRLRLNVIRAEEEGRFQRARVERRHLQHIERPPTLDEAVATERRRIQERAAEASRYTEWSAPGWCSLPKREARGIR